MYVHLYIKCEEFRFVDYLKSVNRTTKGSNEFQIDRDPLFILTEIKFCTQCIESRVGTGCVFGVNTLGCVRTSSRLYGKVHVNRVVLGLG